MIGTNCRCIRFTIFKKKNKDEKQMEINMKVSERFSSYIIDWDYEKYLLKKPSNSTENHIEIITREKDMSCCKKCICNN